MGRTRDRSGMVGLSAGVGRGWWVTIIWVESIHSTLRIQFCWWGQVFVRTSYYLRPWPFVISSGKLRVLKSALTTSSHVILGLPLLQLALYTALLIHTHLMSMPVQSSFLYTTSGCSYTQFFTQHLCTNSFIYTHTAYLISFQSSWVFCMQVL